jgi:hypothetical protein
MQITLIVFVFNSIHFTLTLAYDNYKVQKYNRFNKSPLISVFQVLKAVYTYLLIKLFDLLDTVS